ncbi:MAG: signal peptidase [Verrucomicrobiota bacterium]|jgi:signal peptidase II
MKFIFILSLPLYALDQLTKWWVMHYVDPEMPRVVLPGYFDIVYVTNNGAAFGSFRNNNTFFIALSGAALVFIVALLLRRRKPDAWRDVSLALLLAGVMGNLTDRFMHASVIDFLLFDLHIPFAHPWPAFNVADSCICIAVISFIIHSLRQNKRAAQPAVKL